MEGSEQENPAEPPKATSDASGSNDTGRGPRLREIPLRLMIPNLITVLAICAGLSGIRLAFENRIELAVAMVLLAAFLDGIDGRVARLLKATSNFGGQMDSSPISSISALRRRSCSTSSSWIRRARSAGSRR